MKDLTHTLLIVLIVTFSLSCHKPTNSILGTWQLKSWQFETADSISFPYGIDARGILTYSSDSTMSLTLLKNFRNKHGRFNRDSLRCEESAEAYRSYFHYTGIYEVKQNPQVINHFVINSLVPDWEQTIQHRFYSLSGDTLTLWSDTILPRHHLVWIRKSIEVAK